MRVIPLPLPILILQHPQEPSRKDKAISSAQILMDELSPVHIAVGLSWKNLKHALCDFEELHTDERTEFETPSHWATLYLGTKEQSKGEEKLEPGLYFQKNPKPIHGLIVLDGTWAQAKTMWWRNAWLLKTQRMFLVPKEKSRYGNLRKEPRPECVSTVEAVAETLSFCGMDEAIEKKLKGAFSDALTNFKK